MAIPTMAKNDPVKSRVYELDKSSRDDMSKSLCMPAGKCGTGERFLPL